MPNISKIKVNNEIYDIKDSLSRQQGYAKVICEWDGVTEGLEMKTLGYYTYYKVGEGVELTEEEYLVAPSASAYGAASLMEGGDGISEVMMMSMIAPIFDNINIFVDGVSYKNNYANLFKPFEEMASSAGLDFSLISEHGDCFGLSYLGITAAMPSSGFLGLMPHYINTTKNLVIPAEIMQGLYGIEEEVVFTPGLWLLKIDLGEMVGFKTFPVWPEIVYIPGEDSTKLMNLSLKKLTYLDTSSSGYYISVTGNNGNYADSYYPTTLNSFNDNSSNPTDQRSFKANQIVYVWASVQSGYKLSSVGIVGRDSSLTYEATPINQINSNIYYCTFYMPEEDVDLTYNFSAI